MSLDSIEIFVTVVQGGSFSAAARRLGVPKSTVSLRVAQLEARLGVTLLKRTTRSVSPTEAGAAYFASAARALAELGAAEEEVARAQDEPCGTLRVSATKGSGPIGDLVAGFLARYPRIAVDLQISERRVDLLAERFDIAIRIGPLDDDAGLVARRIGMAVRRLYASPAYLRRRPAPAHPRDLAGHELLRFRPPATTGAIAASDLELTSDAGARARARVDGRFVSNQLSALRHQAVGGGGIVVLPEALALDEVRHERLVPVLPGWRLDTVPIHLVYVKQRYLTARVRAFLDYAARALPPAAFGRPARPRRRAART